MNILILGATGRVGRAILKKALYEHHHVTVILRSPCKLDVESYNLTKIKGDVLDTQLLIDTIENQDLIFSALGTDNQNTISRSMPAILKGMSLHNVQRLITIGTAGILNSRFESGRYRFQTKESRRSTTKAAEDHLKAYQMLLPSTVNWTIVCPTHLVDGEEEGKYRIEKERLPKNGKRITVGDTASFAYSLLNNNTYNNVRVGIAY